MPLLVAAVILVAALCLLDLLLTFGVIRRLRDHTAVLERLLNDGLGRRPAGDDMPEPGDAVGEFTAITVDGETMTTARLTERTVIAFLSTDCGACLKQLPQFIEAVDGLDRDRVLGVITGERADAAELLELLAPVARVVVEPAGASVATAFGVSAYPTFVIAEHGVVRGTAVNASRLPDATRV